ncbi:T9SS type A sorting domain-containing protein [candidate division KSB1 bacterium]|nr:T9SS type A sorting domain-containing protein [candidate division KSB1 bacterium]
MKYFCFVFVLMLIFELSTSANLLAQGPGNALNFDGSNDYVSVADDNSLDITDAITIEAWVNGVGNTSTTTYDFTDNTNNKAYGTLLGADTPLNPGHGSYIEYNSGQYTAVNANDGSRNIWAATSYNTWANLWYRFKINEALSDITQVAITWTGYDELSNFGDFELNTWNFTGSAWNQWFTTSTPQSTDQTYSETYTSGFSDIIDGSGYLSMGISGSKDKGISCPFIFPWNGSEYEVDNDIMPFLHPFMEETVDYYRLMKPLKPRDGVYPLMIKDIVPEMSYYDKLELWTVDHPEEVDVWPDLDGNIFTVRDPQPPISCIDNNDFDCLTLFEANEGYEAQKYYTGQKDDWIIVDFGDLSNHKDLKLILTTDYSINVQVLGDFQIKGKDGEWKTQLTISPHLLWATNVIDMSQWLPDANGEYKMRFYFTQPHRIDWLAIDTSEEVPIKVEKLSPIKVDHSRVGDVRSLILESDDKRTVTNGYKGEEMFLEFLCHKMAREEAGFWQKISNFLSRRDPYQGWERDFIFVGEGYYVQPDNPAANGFLSEEDYLELKKYGYEGPEDYEKYRKEHHSVYENYVKVEVTTKAKMTSKGNDAYALLMDSGNILGYINGESISTSTPSGWNHIALTYNKDAGTNNQKLYVNGVLKTQQTVSGAITTNANNLIIGDLFNGTIDEVRIWNVARSVTDIRANMCKKLAGAESNLIGYWQLDEPSGSSCTDSSPNTNTGTMTNMDGGDHVWSGVAIGDASTYDYSSPSSVNLASGDGDDVTVGTITNSPDGVQIYRVDSEPNVTTPPGDLNQLSQEHYFGVFIVGGSSPTYTLTYNYDGHLGIQNEDNLDLASRSNNATTSWTDLDATLDTGANTLIKTGQTGTEYILGSTSDNSLPVELAMFSAEAVQDGILLKWTTESEVNNVGFILERKSAETGWQTIASYQTHNALIGQGNTSSRTEYGFVDEDVQPSVTCFYRLSDVDIQGNVTIDDVITITLDELPGLTELLPAFPNPFNPQTKIQYTLSENVDVTLSVVDMQGRTVQTIIKGQQQIAGSYSVHWNGKDHSGRLASSGTYLLVLRAGQIQKTQKVMMVR